jgi:hypothetical protein
VKSYTWRHAVINSPLQGTTKHVLLVLSCHINDAGEAAYPSTERLSWEAGVSEPTVVKHLRIAKLAGWLVARKHGFGGQGWARNEYFPAIPEGFEVPQFISKRAKRALVPPEAELSTEALNQLKHEGTEGTKPALAPSGEALNLTAEGTKPDAIKALNEVKSNYSYELPNNYPSTGASAGTAEEGEKAGEQNQTEPASKFERFWNVWPSHSGRKTGGRPDCAKHWAEKGLDKDAELIIAHVGAMKLTKKWIDGYDPRPLRYLEECWWHEGAPDAVPVAAAAGAEADAEWWTSTSGVEQQASRIGYRAVASGKGPWISYVLKHAQETRSPKFYEWVRTQLGDGLLPTDDFAS